MGTCPRPRAPGHRAGSLPEQPREPGEGPPTAGWPPRCLGTAGRLAWPCRAREPPPRRPVGSLHLVPRLQLQTPFTVKQAPGPWPGAGSPGSAPRPPREASAAMCTGRALGNSSWSHAGSAQGRFQKLWLGPAPGLEESKPAAPPPGLRAPPPRAQCPSGPCTGHTWAFGAAGPPPADPGVQHSNRRKRRSHLARAPTGQQRSLAPSWLRHPEKQCEDEQVSGPPRLRGTQGPSSGSLTPRRGASVCGLQAGLARRPAPGLRATQGLHGACTGLAGLAGLASCSVSRRWDMWSPGGRAEPKPSLRVWPLPRLGRGWALGALGPLHLRDLSCPCLPPSPPTRWPGGSFSVAGPASVPLRPPSLPFSVSLTCW